MTILKLLLSRRRNKMTRKVFAPEINHYQALVTNIADGPIVKWLDRFSGEAFDGNFKNAPLATLLENFRTFSHSYFDWIIKNHSLNNRQSRQTRHVLYKALTNLSDEWSIIHRACLQRENLIFRNELLDTDEAARHLYVKFKVFDNLYKNNEDENLLMPVTYYGKLFSITRYVFTNVPILSVPLQTLGSPHTSQSGLAHELGHHFYWNSLPEISDLNEMHRYISRLIKEAVAHYLDEHEDCRPETYDCTETYCLEDIWLNWQEELFADICGTFLLGPQYIESSLRIVDEQGVDFESLVNDDLKHPISYLRPFICLSILDWLIDNPRDDVNQDAYDALREERSSLNLNWKELEAIVLNSNDQNQYHRQYKSVSLSCLQKSVPIIIQALLGSSEPGIGNKEEKYSLSELIDYSEWLANLPNLNDKKANRAFTDISNQYNLDTVNVDNSHFFENLLQSIQSESSGQEEVFTKLLEMELGVEEYSRNVTIVWGKFIMGGRKRKNARYLNESC